MLNQRHVDLTVHNTVFLDIWWNMLIKFSKEIGHSFAEIIKTTEMDLFPQIVTGFRDELRVLPNI